jgi:antitoxin component YwqK of YwqJK toxin-antitoxin module
MKNSLKLNRKLFFFLLAIAPFTHAQNLISEIETISVNGKTYYVYPTKKEIDKHSSYLTKERRSKYNYEDYKDELTKKAFKRLVNQKISSQGFLFMGYERRKNQKLKKLMGKNPMPFLEPNYNLSYDLIPPLDPIPDGEYVQLFEDYYPTNWLLKESKTPEQRVAAYFTIKNNVIEGLAVWLNLEGDTLKKGTFVKGIKEGEWTLEQRDLPYSFYYTEIAYFKKYGYPEVDTTYEIFNFKNGELDGYYARYNRSVFPVEEGYYKNNEEVGTWLKRNVKVTGWGAKKKRNRNNTLVTSSCTFAEEKIPVKQPIIRFEAVSLPSYSDAFYNFSSKFDVDLDFYEFFDFVDKEQKDASLELEEEEINSYADFSYRNEYAYENSYDDASNDASFNNMIYDYSTGEYVSLSKYIDSVGIAFDYTGTYEKFYPNGQLKCRFIFEKGYLKEEDTVFWDNGQPADVIQFVADSNHYLRSIYDYDGKLFKSAIYDSSGAFIRMEFLPVLTEKVFIEGYEVVSSTYDDYYFYDNRENVYKSNSDTNLLSFHSWAVADSSKTYQEFYHPDERHLTQNWFGLSGAQYQFTDIQFGEQFNNWNGIKRSVFGPLELKSTLSASLNDFGMPIDQDTLPEIKIKYFDEPAYFQTNEESVFLLDNAPYTGVVDVKFAARSYKLKTGNVIRLQFPSTKKASKIAKYNLKRFDKKGTIRNPDFMNRFDRVELGQSEYLGGDVLSSLFACYIGEYADIHDGYNYYYESRPDKSGFKGQFLNGKPEGLWTIYDGKGQVSATIPFHNGNIDGTVTTYATAYPYKWNINLYETYPEKKTYYVQSTDEYKNGLRNGASTTFYWDGQIESYTEYKDGYHHGKAYERNNLAHSSWNNTDGELDGYVRTYLTLKNKDSMLLYSLNFQNGLLQGESKSYHTSGKLAKRGFFLNGEPIEDYEAYDTLGFKYHYVKFEYGYPVEEKIWEENKLSVRYLFDWKDSIYFAPTDITETQSLDRVLSDLGLIKYYSAYHGRPSLVEKDGICFHVTKYYPNDKIARDGEVINGKKRGCWRYYNYDGEFLYEVDYFDSIITLNDSVRFKSKGVLTDFNAKGEKISESYVIEKFEKYDCSHTDHYEIRQLYTFWQQNDTVDRINGYVKNFYDNGVLQNEGMMKNGLPTGVWKFYDPFGKLNLVGSYSYGKRNGRWLSGDLSKSKYIGDICLDPNLPNLDEELSRREKELEIKVVNYNLGKVINSQNYDLDLNEVDPLYQEERYFSGHYVGF